MELQVALGKVVRRHREATGLSQERFAIQAGIDRTVWVAVEGGRRNLSLTSLERIADALGVAASALVAEAEAEKNSKRR